MNKSDLIVAIADDSGLTKADAARALSAATSAISGALSNGDKVSITGFGSFLVRSRSARSGRNPQTALIWIVAPVCGLRPERAERLLTKKLPKPVMETLSPFDNAPEIALVVADRARASGDKVSITGFGSFLVRSRAARSGRNPQTGATIQISASKVPAFKAGKLLKESVN
jgi:DNA-binding protein HU-beta